MPSEIRIPIPKAGGMEADVLVEWFQVRLEKLSAALDLVVSEFDKKAKIDVIKIEAVDVTGSTVTVTYRLSFSASDTCRGIDYSGTHQRTVHGIVDGRDWMFEPSKPLPKRSTADEL